MTKYRRKYLCICEGQQETMYLAHVAKLIRDFPRKVVTFNTLEGPPSRLEKRYEDYKSAAVFDFDFNEVEFRKKIELCDRLNRKRKPSKERHIYHAYSSVNFDLWLILHKENFNREVSKNDAYVSDVRRIYNLSASENIKSEGAMQKILSQITVDDVKEAIERADFIRKGKMVGDGIKTGDTTIHSNPDFSIHEFLRVVLKDSGDL